MGDWPIARPLSTQDSTKQKNTDIIPVLNRIQTHNPSQVVQDYICPRPYSHWNWWWYL